MQSAKCLVEELAQVMAQDHNLKAVTLHTAQHKLSYAFQGNSSTEKTAKRLEEVLGSYDQAVTRACAGMFGANSCAECGAEGAAQLPMGIRLVPMPEMILLEKESCVTAPRFWRWRDIAWVKFEARAPEMTEAEDWRLPMASAVACGVFLGAGYFSPSPWSYVFFVIAYASGGWHAAHEVWERLEKRVLDVHFLMLLVAVGAATLGAWWEGAMLLFLFSLSGALEEYAFGRTQKEIGSLLKRAPRFATVLDAQGHEQQAAVEELKAGMLFRVKPGESIPVDGEVTAGESALDESTLTGEADPVNKGVGDTVLSGTLNVWGRLDCKVLRPASDSALAKVIRLIQTANENKAPSQRLADRFGSIYTYGILGMSIIMFLVWWLVMSRPLHTAFYQTMTLLVVASPCALVLSIPSGILAAIAAGARHGVLFRGGEAIENLAEIKRVAVDKTGTLTTGQFKVLKIESQPAGSEDRVLTWAATLDSNSTHPLAQAIVRSAKEKKLKLEKLEKFRSITGQGLEGDLEVNGTVQTVRLGRRSLCPEAQWPEPSIGVTEVLLEGGGLHGRILMQDEVREESRPLLERLHRRGVEVTMLTGDREEAARRVADQVGLKDVRFGLKPEDKVAAIEGWMKSGEMVAMVGDGINDAPSLAAAHVGVAMGMRGSDAALEQADVVLTQDRLENFVVAYDLSARARSIIRQNLVLSIGSIVILVIAALGNKIALTIGVFGHEGTTAVVVLNGLRLLLTKKSNQ